MSTQPQTYLTPEGQWLLSETDSVDEVIELPSIACRLPVADIYEKVEFET